MKKSSLVKILKQELSILNDFIDDFNDIENIQAMEVDMALSKVNDINNALELLKKSTVSLFGEQENITQNNTTENRVFTQPNVKSKPEAVIDKIEESIEPESVVKDVAEQQEIDLVKDNKADLLSLSDDDNLEQAPYEEPVNNEYEGVIIQDEEREDEEVRETQVSELVNEPDELNEEEVLDVAQLNIVESDTVNLVEESIEEEVVENEPIREAEPVVKESILADKFSQNAPSVNDMLAGVKKNKDLASLLKDSPITDLNKAIKLNDRIWYINELFGKNSAVYEKAIQTVNNAENLDAALEYLFTNFKWNQERKSTISFLELVFRRFATN